MSLNLRFKLKGSSRTSSEVLLLRKFSNNFCSVFPGSGPCIVWSEWEQTAGEKDNDKDEDNRWRICVRWLAPIGQDVWTVQCGTTCIAKFSLPGYTFFSDSRHYCTYQIRPAKTYRLAGWNACRYSILLSSFANYVTRLYPGGPRHSCATTNGADSQYTVFITTRCSDHCMQVLWCYTSNQRIFLCQLWKTVDCVSFREGGLGPSSPTSSYFPFAKTVGYPTVFANTLSCRDRPCQRPWSQSES